MELTQKELEVANKVLKEIERKATSWPRMRWFNLIFFTFMTVSGLFYFRCGFDTIANNTQIKLEPIKELPSQQEEHLWAVGSMIKIAKILELRQKSLNLALLESGGGLFMISLGLAIIIITIMRWNNADRDSLLYKILSYKLKEEIEQTKSSD